MKKAFFLLILLLNTQVSANSLCNVREPDKDKFRTKDNMFHVFFVRCHPTLPLAFSNRLTPTSFGPVMIDMKTGKITTFETPKGFTSEDMVPSPDGKYLYVDLGNTEERFLGLYGLENGGIIQKKLLKVEDGTIYGYPSPVIRNGKHMILGRRDRIHLDTVDEENGILKKGPEICGELKSIDRPYISPDGEYIGLASKNKMQILKIKWDEASPNQKSIPCETVAELPSSAGKVSFSPDNKKVVFHASQSEYLGRNTLDSGGPKSFMMDIATGETIQLGATGKEMSSEYPYFCGDQGIIVRDLYTKGKKNSVTFRIVPVPKTKAEICEEKSDEHKNLTGFWEAVCAELYPSVMKPAFDIQVSKKNCEELLKVWRKKKNKSRFKEEELQAACQ